MLKFPQQPRDVGEFWQLACLGIKLEVKSWSEGRLMAVAREATAKSETNDSFMLVRRKRK